MQAPKVPHSHQATIWIVIISILVVAIVMAACAFGAFKMIEDGKKNPKATPSASPNKRDISSQAVDPAPLTEQEVFPQQTVTPVATEPGYPVLKTQAATDCTTAATGDLGALLTSKGCTQVVMGTLKHPTGNYLVTAGIFNLKDQDQAKSAHDAIKGIIDAQKGRFNGLMAGTGTEPIARAATQLAWNVSGHFLAYCVIARADSQAFADGDKYPEQIIFDLVGTYLVKGVIGAREIPTAGASATAGNPKPSAK
jgi:hypothetical protein